MPNCFVIMPFRPELGFLYQAIKADLEHKFAGLSVARGDDKVLTTPLLDKIADFIRQADVVIADCSGRNPNVFYELGMAHSLAKPVILITSDPVEHAPSDIRAFEFISYAGQPPEQFFDKLAGAMEAVVGSPYHALYERATTLFASFCESRGLSLPPVAEQQFSTMVSMLESAGQRVPPAGSARDEYLLRRMLGAEPSIDLLIAVQDWLNDQA